MDLLGRYLGELAALSAAGIWAGSSIVYGRMGQNISPIALNLSKGAISIVYLLITLVMTGERVTWQPALWPLLLSGLIGIAIGDTLFFAALNRIGARLTLLINTLSPAIAALLANFYLAEHLSLINYLGIGVAIAGIAGVVSVQTSRTGQARHYWWGVSCAVLSALSNAVASVLSRQVMLQHDLSPIGATLLRLGAGTIGILFLLAILPAWRKQAMALKADRQSWSLLAVTAFFSTYVGISLQQTALKYAAVGIAQTVSATSPLFVLVFDWWQGEKIGWKPLCYALVTVGGVSLLFQ